MENDNRLILLKTMICDFAEEQFRNNEISPAGANMVMQCVFQFFQEKLLDSIMLDTVKAQLSQTQDGTKQPEASE